MGMAERVVDGEVIAFDGHGEPEREQYRLYEQRDGLERSRNRGIVTLATSEAKRGTRGLSCAGVAALRILAVPSCGRRRGSRDGRTTIAQKNVAGYGIAVFRRGGHPPACTQSSPSRRNMRRPVAQALRQVVALYESTFNAPVGSLKVLRDEEAFDWKRGRFYQKATREPVGRIDLSTGLFEDWRHE